MSTQPGRSSRNQSFFSKKGPQVSPDGRGQNIPGIGSFPCRFKKAE